jgi:transposase-like protein
MSLKLMEQMPLKPELMTCPECGEEKRIGIHSHQERRYICHVCKATFAETKGTLLYGLHYPIWVLVLTLLAHGCPVQAIVVAFGLDERTVAAWQSKAGQQGERIQAAIVCNGRVELGQVQADEICVTTQHGKVWMATAMTVFSRLFLWVEVGAHRTKGLIERVMAHVRAAARASKPSCSPSTALPLIRKPS